MSSNDELSSDEESSVEVNDEEYSYHESELLEEEGALSVEDLLFRAKVLVQQAIRGGENVNVVHNDTTPLMKACEGGFDEIVDILLDAGADTRWGDRYGESAITTACENGHLSTVQLLINHDNGLLEMASNQEWTPLFHAINEQHSDIVRFLLDSGADPHHVDESGQTTLMIACRFDNLELVRLALAAGVDVEARDYTQQTALHHAAFWGRSEIIFELILQHNANMIAEDEAGRKPFSLALRRLSNADIDRLIEIYSNKLTEDHGRLALHELLKVAYYSFADGDYDFDFHPPLNPLTVKIILPLDKLALKDFRTLLHTFDPELIRNRDDTGKLPIHIACQKFAPVEVLAFILELDPAGLHIADSTGALPIHLLCGTSVATEYASVRYLVEQGGVGTLAARNRQGLLPLHVLCSSPSTPHDSSAYTQLRACQFLIQSFPGSVAVRTNTGEYPFMMAASAKFSWASLSVIYELVRANPGVIDPR